MADAPLCQHMECRALRGEWNEGMARTAAFGNIPPCPDHGLTATPVSADSAPETSAYRAVTDEYGNPVWQASSEGDGMCPVCAHAPDLHGYSEGCCWHYQDGTHLTEPTGCHCPLVVLLTDDMPASADGASS